MLYYTLLTNTFNPFIFLVNSGSDAKYSIPKLGIGYNYSWKSSDGQSGRETNNVHTINFPDINTDYTIEIKGKFPQIFVSNNIERLKLKDIIQWGDIIWRSFDQAFFGCENLQISAIDAPNLKQVTTLSSIFLNCFNFNSDISNWDVSNIEIMHQVFLNCSNFNQDISNWDVSSVTNMTSMFQGASSFNQPLDNWDVSNVIYMINTFYGCILFNQDLPSWDISSVISMNSMFNSCYALTNLDVSNWDVSNVITMNSTFAGCVSLISLPLNNWNVSKVESFVSFATLTYVLGVIDFSNWDVSNVINFGNMFNQGCSPIGLSSWDFSSAVTISQMLWANNTINLANGNSIIKLNTSSNLTSIALIVGGQSPYTNGLIDLEITDCTNVTTAYWSFQGANGINRLILTNLPVSFDISQTSLLSSGIDNLANSVADLTGLDYQTVTMSTYQKNSCNESLWYNKNWAILEYGVTFTPFIMTINSGVDSQFTIPKTGTGYAYTWSTSDSQSGFSTNGLHTIIFPSPNTDYDIEISGNFPQIYVNSNSEKLKVKEIKQWGDIKWSSMNKAFVDCVNLIITATDAPNFINCSSLSYMFYGCWSIGDIDVSTWNVSNINNFNATFEYNGSSPIGLDSWDLSGALYLTQMLWANSLIKLSSGNNSIVLNTSSNLLTITGIIGGQSPFTDGVTNLEIINCSNVVNALNVCLNSYGLTSLLLWNLPVSFSISQSSLLTGTSIDNLANSVADLTGLSSSTITMTISQKTSCDETIWLNKNWTIVEI